MIDLLFIVTGVVFLYGGGEALVRGSIRLAAALGLSPLVIGLTVVAFGTSSPELATTLLASFQGAPDLALGNILGSNIANVGLILGIAVLLRPLQASAKILRREIPFMLAVGALLLPMAWDGKLGRWDGTVLLVLFVLFLWVLFRQGEAPPGLVEDDALGSDGGAKPRTWLSILMVIGGVLLLVSGAEVLVRGAVSLARSIGVSEQVIGLSMVAVGTSLPELASSIVAVIRRQGDLLLGNIVGSNIFNVLLVLAITVLAHPLDAGFERFGRDFVASLVMSLLMVPLLLAGTRRRLFRVEGLILLAAYGGYMVYLFRVAT